MHVGRQIGAFSHMLPYVTDVGHETCLFESHIGTIYFIGANLIWRNWDKQCRLLCPFVVLKVKMLGKEKILSEVQVEIH